MTDSGQGAQQGAGCTRCETLARQVNGLRAEVLALRREVARQDARLRSLSVDSLAGRVKAIERALAKPAKPGEGAGR